ncbi:MAG: lysophospholipid acyltransferase family protein [bacterium]|nr:lipid A biosynthesis lauroyl acyltransferase [Gammaproteobacteria bacterium]HIL96740.1 lipid A biosynthesis lauroyl acyltransferase [Pseudomonadales bacterium]
MERITRKLLEGALHLFASLPLGVSRWIGEVIGKTNHLLGTRAARVTHDNLALCFPALSVKERVSLEKCSLIHTGQTMMEIPAVWLGNFERVQGWILGVENEHLLDEAINQGRGVLVLLPHHGNWEMFNAYFASRGKMTALYQPPRQDLLKPLMQGVREKFGNELVATNVKGLARLYRCLEQGQIVTVLPDQVPASGEFVPFFGHDALTDVLVSRLLKKTGAAAVCCVVIRQNRGFKVRFSRVEEAIYSSQLMESLGALNSSIEGCIADQLEQYQWDYKRFRERPVGMKKLYKFNDEADLFHE